MEGTRQRCDCELSLEEATKGDLPQVCVWCGEVANSVCAVRLYHQMRRANLHLPLCSADQNHWRRRDWAFYAFLAGVLLLASGVLLIVCTVAVLSDDRERMVPIAAGDALFLTSSSMCFLGFVIMVASLAAYVILTTRSIQIRHLGHETITLTRMAPEFAEAYRVHCYEKRGQEQ